MAAPVRAQRHLADDEQRPPVAHDVEGAARHGIATIGVSWGYAADDELARAGAVAVVDTAEQLAALLLPRAQDETADVH